MRFIVIFILIFSACLLSSDHIENKQKLHRENPEISELDSHALMSMLTHDEYMFKLKAVLASINENKKNIAHKKSINLHSPIELKAFIIADYVVFHSATKSLARYVARSLKESNESSVCRLGFNSEWHDAVYAFWGFVDRFQFHRIQDKIYYNFNEDLLVKVRPIFSKLRDMEIVDESLVAWNLSQIYIQMVIENGSFDDFFMETFHSAKLQLKEENLSESMDNVLSDLSTKTWENLMHPELGSNLYIQSLKNFYSVVHQ